MRAEIYSITGIPSGRLAILARPRGGDWLVDEVAAWKKSGIDTIVSLLTESEVADLNLGAEAECCREFGLRFIQHGVSDRTLPSSQVEWTKLIAELVAELRNGRSMGIHCRMGIGRSTMLAVCVLAAMGVPVEEGWDLVQKARGIPVPDTAEQRKWVSEFAELYRVNPDAAV